MKNYYDLDELLGEINTDDVLEAFGVTNEVKEDVDWYEMQTYYYSRPCEFVEDMLSLVPDPHQREVLESVRDNKRTAVRSGQGVGKTAIVSGLIIWYLFTRYQAKIIATAPNMAQLNTVLWAEIAKWLEGSPISAFVTHTKTRLYVNGYEKSWFAFPKTANSKEGMAGQHADHLLIICDEASGILDEILETLLGTISGPMNKILLISNPTRNSGTYYNAFHQDREMYNCIHINSRNVARVDRENINMLIRSYGENSNVVRVRVDGDFPSQEDDVFISLDSVESAFAREWINRKVAAIKIGVDVARFGDDSTVIVSNIGGNIHKIDEKRGKGDDTRLDTMSTAYNAIKIAQEERLFFARKQYCMKCSKFKECQNGNIRRCTELARNSKGIICDSKGEPIKMLPVVIITDDTGVGGGVTDKLREEKRVQGLDWLYILRVNAAAKVDDPYVKDVTTYMYKEVRDALEEGECTLPNDIDKMIENNLIGQFTCRKFTTPGGKIQIEPKDSMKKRGLKSPDISDAIALSFYPVNLDKLISTTSRPGRRR